MYYYKENLGAEKNDIIGFNEDKMCEIAKYATNHCFELVGNNKFMYKGIFEREGYEKIVLISGTRENEPYIPIENSEFPNIFTYNILAKDKIFYVAKSKHYSPLYVSKYTILEGGTYFQLKLINQENYGLFAKQFFEHIDSTIGKFCICKKSIENFKLKKINEVKNKLRIKNYIYQCNFPLSPPCSSYCIKFHF